MPSRSRLFLCSCVLSFAVVPLASAQVLWSEPVDGELSDNPLAPSSANLVVGTQSLFGVVGGKEHEDFLSVTVPAGAQLTQLNLVSYDSEDGTAFIAVQAGPAITTDIANPNPADLLGWSHFGSGPGNVGTDILDDIGNGAGAIGFTPPLPAGTYTFWIQQGGSPSAYRFDFVVVPTPGSLALLGIGGIVSMRRRRR